MDGGDVQRPVEHHVHVGRRNVNRGHDDRLRNVSAHVQRAAGVHAERGSSDGFDGRRRHVQLLSDRCRRVAAGADHGIAHLRLHEPTRNGANAAHGRQLHVRRGDVDEVRRVHVHDRGRENRLVQRGQLKRAANAARQVGQSDVNSIQRRELRRATDTDLEVAHGNLDAVESVDLHAVGSHTGNLTRSNSDGVMNLSDDVRRDRAESGHEIPFCAVRADAESARGRRDSIALGIHQEAGGRREGQRGIAIVGRDRRVIEGQRVHQHLAGSRRQRDISARADIRTVHDEIHDRSLINNAQGVRGESAADHGAVLPRDRQQRHVRVSLDLSVHILDILRVVRPGDRQAPAGRVERAHFGRELAKLEQPLLFRFLHPTPLAAPFLSNHQLLLATVGGQAVIRREVQLEQRERHVGQRALLHPGAHSLADRMRRVRLLKAEVRAVHERVEKAFHRHVRGGKVSAIAVARIVSRRVSRRENVTDKGRLIQRQPRGVQRRHLRPAPPLRGRAKVRRAIRRGVERVDRTNLVRRNLAANFKLRKLRGRRAAHSDGEGAILGDRHGVVASAAAPRPAALQVNLRPGGCGSVPGPQVEVRGTPRLHDLDVPTGARGWARRQRQVLLRVDARGARVQRERTSIHEDLT